MGIKQFFSRLFKKYFFYPKWRCVNCGEEIFNSKAFCPQCEKILPIISGKKCNHCGRQTLQSEEYCLTCKNVLVEIDFGRSAFNYQPPISNLIIKSKYHGAKYLLEIFAQYLSSIYLQNYFNADYLCFVPMTKKAQKERGYNQSEILCNYLSKRISVPVINCVKKIKETTKQAQLSREERLKNLTTVFSITNRAKIKDKTIVIVDDVTTTGATAQAISKKLKKAGAKKVCLITVASVPAIDKQ